MADANDCARAFALIAALRPQQTLPAASMMAYAVDLADIDGELLLAATLRALRSTTYLPQSGEIRAQALLIVNEELACGATWAASFATEPRWSHLLPSGLAQLQGIKQIEGPKS